MGPTDKPLADADVQKLCVGKRFILSISPEVDETPHWAMTWAVKDRAWVMKVLQVENGRSCPAPYQPSRATAQGNSRSPVLAK
jgi:hypothetical protein